MKIMRYSFLNRQTNEIVNRVVREKDKNWFSAIAEVHAEYDEVGEHGTLHIQFDEV